MTRTPTTTSTSTRFRGERGIAVIMTALCLLPLMAFAAFGVDLASFYSRASYLQKSADAAALAGTVWMPNLAQSRTVACDSLLENGIDGGDCGTGPFEVTIERGSTATALRVVVTDPSATRYFSQVLGNGDQRLTRRAEAEYNLPIPLGSPLNYFGGDSTKNTSHDETTYSVVWPSTYNSVRPTSNTFPCNVGTAAVQGHGQWTNATSFNATGYSGSTRCFWSVVGQDAGTGTSPVPPPDYETRVPTNSGGTGCRVRTNGTADPFLGRWTGTTFTTTGANSGTVCTWTNFSNVSMPSSGHYQTAGNVTNRPCNVGYAGSAGGSWPSSGGYSSSRFTGSTALGNRLCQFTAQLSQTTVTVPDGNQIDPARDPRFWALIEGPGTASTQGDAYTPRCYINENCGSVQNQSYRDTANPDRGYWYVVKIPAGLTGQVDINVYDASNNPSGSLSSLAGDSSLNASNQAFETEYRVYRQNNPLEFTNRTPVTGGAGNTTLGSCFWQLHDESSFRANWRNLCTLGSVSPGEVYLVNVRTNGTTGSGVNGYALEACANGSCSAGVQPALYAYADMAMYNNVSSGNATFYLAEVGPQYAGRTLVLELWDAGDASGDATIFPMMPSASQPKPVVNVPAGACTYTSSPAPNAVQSSSVGGATGVINATPHASDNGTDCAIRSTIGGARQFNGEWLRIRIDLPTTYTCTPGVNPETTAGSCWWGIKYNFTSSATDVTTWQARIEGNPVHLTQ